MDLNTELGESSSMIADSIEKLRDSLYVNWGLNNLPEFKGSPSEDIEKFLKDFGRATSTHTHSQKCQALRRALTGDAEMFLKKYLKYELNNNDWKRIKEGLRKRFSQIDLNLIYRTKLNKMTYSPERSTLLGYADRFADLYRKVHRDSKDKELVEELALNLGNDIVRRLNLISADWRKTADFEEFRQLLTRLEKDIIALERKDKKVDEDMINRMNSMVTSALEQPLAEIKKLLVNANPKPEVKEAVAAVKHGRYPPEKPEQGYHQGKRNYREWNDTGNQYKKRNEQYSKRYFDDRANELKNNYERKFGRVNGPCFLCQGLHFRRHCPFEDENLN